MFSNATTINFVWICKHSSGASYLDIFWFYHLINVAFDPWLEAVQDKSHYIQPYDISIALLSIWIAKKNLLFNATTINFVWICQEQSDAS